MLRRIFHSQYLYFFLFLFGGGLLSMQLRYELSWDFANYHYFNAWAFVKDRVGYDFLVAGINTYFNPLIDVPLYYLIEYFNDAPGFIFFMQGLWAGAVAFVFYKFLRLFFDFSGWRGRVSVILVWLIGITSWPFFMQIGSSTNEIQSSLLIMCGFYLLFKELLSAGSQRLKFFAAAGLLLGAAMGLKLTAVTYCISSGMALIACSRFLDRPVKTIVVFACCGLLGFLLLNGFWMLKLWDLYGNPFFPFLNGIFHSDYYAFENYRDENYLPQAWWGYFFHPLYMAFVNEVYEGNMLIVDIREGLVFFMLLVSFLVWLQKGIRSGKLQPVGRSQAVLLIFFVCSYTVWLALFCIYRYAIPLNFMGAVIIVRWFWHFEPQGEIRRIIYFSLFNIVLFSLLSTPYYSDVWSRHNSNATFKPEYQFSLFVDDAEYKKRFTDYGYFTQYAELEDVNLPDNTLLLMHHIPGAAILPMLARKINIRGVLVKGGKIHALTGFNNEKIVPEMEKIISSHRGFKAYLIALHEKMGETKRSIEEVTAQGMKCFPLINNQFPWLLCVPAGTEKQIFKGMKP